MLNTDDNKFVSNESIGAQLHTPPESFSDSFALFVTKSLRFFADTLFRKRYGHRAVVLETVAGVPGMVAGVVHHLRSLRNCLLYTSPSPRDYAASRMPSSA